MTWIDCFYDQNLDYVLKIDASNKKMLNETSTMAMMTLRKIMLDEMKMVVIVMPMVGTVGRNRKIKIFKKSCQG